MTAHKHSWNYFNGEHFTKRGTGEAVHIPMTEWYCGECAPAHIKGWAATHSEHGREHWGTGFRCAPWRVGAPCRGCGKDI